jgi:hypothetical protein
VEKIMPDEKRNVEEKPTVTRTVAELALGRYLCGQWIRRDGDHEAWMVRDAPKARDV